MKTIPLKRRSRRDTLPATRADRRRAGALYLLAGVALAASVQGALSLAAQLARNDVQAQALGDAREALRRSEAITDQTAQAFEQLAVSTQGRSCSGRQQERMRAIDMSSAYIQAVGHVQGTHMVCSSLGGASGPIDLGPVDVRTPAGVNVRFDQPLSTAAGEPAIVLERDGYVAMINDDLPLDITTRAPDTSLATVLLPSHRVIASRGPMRPEWLTRAVAGSDVTFTDDGVAVAAAASSRHHFAALATVAPDVLHDRQGSLSLRLGAAGLGGGLLLAAGIIVLAPRRPTSGDVLRKALQRDEFYLEYQPIVRLCDNQIVGAEALLRWRSPDGLPSRPDIFIPLAEQEGLLQQLTQRMFQLVGRHVDAIFAAHESFHLSLNLTAVDLEDTRCIQELTRLRARVDVRSGTLIAEITERSLLDPVTAQPNIVALRTAGVGVAIDDFGTDYSSLSYLETLEIDYLKIDRTFVQSVDTHASNSCVVRHIISMGRELGLVMIAEGVERHAQADYLRGRGVEYAQGWLYGVPMPIESLLALVRSDRGPVDAPSRSTTPMGAGC